MPKDALPPTQLAYDRLQQASVRSPLVVGNVRLVYELCKEGICIRAKSALVYKCFELVRIVSWHQLAMCHANPLNMAETALLEQMERALQPVETGS
jgi:hypothetical protein